MSPAFLSRMMVRAPPLEELIWIKARVPAGRSSTFAGRMERADKIWLWRPSCLVADVTTAKQDAAFFEEMSNQWREELNCCLREIERLNGCKRRPLFHGRGRAASRTRTAHKRPFAKQDPREKTAPAELPALQLHRGDGEVVAIFRQPLDLWCRPP